MDEKHVKRFWEKVNKNGPVVKLELGPCWLWTASKRNGYGAFAVNRKAQQAHRVAWFLEYGYLPGLLRHKCDNRSCIRTSHLEPGTHKDNTQDMLVRGNSRSELTNDQVVEARRRAAGGESIHLISKDLGDKALLLLAIQGKTFKHVEERPVDLKSIYRPILQKLTEKQYKEIIEAIKNPYHGQGKALAKKYNVDPSMITLIKKGKLKSINVAS